MASVQQWAMESGQQWAMASVCSTLCSSLTAIRPQSKAEAILHTFLALTRATVSCAENSYVSLCAGSARLTE